MSTPVDSSTASRLERITTNWSQVNNPVHFVMCYGPPVQRYLQAILKSRDDAEEVLQDFLTRVVERGFENAAQVRGRFRDYVKAAARNAAMTWLRRRRAWQPLQVEQWEQSIVDPANAGASAVEQQWLDDWRNCLLEKAWRELERHERASPDNLFHTVLRATVDFPRESSTELADRVARAIGRELLAPAFRKQLSRARAKFAELLVAEISQTLDSPSDAVVRDELIDLGLFEYVKDFLA